MNTVIDDNQTVVRPLLGKERNEDSMLNIYRVVNI